jgi:GNAT superfamily N-acetyltransferase
MSANTVRTARREGLLDESDTFFLPRRTDDPVDVETILAFMRATATEQNAAHAVTATEADILRTLYFVDESEDCMLSRTHPLGRALLSISADDKITGMAIYFFTLVAWMAKPGVCLEDLYVLPEHRHEGVAKLLVKTVTKHAKKAGCERMEWLCYKQNARALGFYKKIGAREVDTVTVLRLDQSSMEHLILGDAGDE